MGTFEQHGETIVFRQDSGEITARFHSSEEKMTLSHQGSTFYRWVFNLLVSAGAIYLTLFFLFV